MGLGPSKGKIKKILTKSVAGDPDIIKKGYLKCSYNVNARGPSDQEANQTAVEFSKEESVIFEVSSLQSVPLTSTQTAVKQNTYFPYSSVGTLLVDFPKADETKEFTCFLVEENVVVTLATNLYDPKYGGEAKTVKTSFSDAKIKPANIIFHDSFQRDKKTTNPDCLLAVLIYEEKVFSEYLGVRSEIQGDGSNMFLVSSCGLKRGKAEDEANEDGEENGNAYMERSDGPFKQSDIHSLYVTLDQDITEDQNDEILLEKCLGAPVYYRDMNNDVYVVGILTKDHKIMRISKSHIEFLLEKVNLGHNLLHSDKKEKIEEDKIQKLDLSRNDFGPLDIKYLSEFDLKNLIYLDLGSNAIKPQGAYYLSQGKYPQLKTLNLNFNEIGDEGISHIANANFNMLEQLFLFHNNISYVGIEHLCKADFIQSLVILSLSENPQITNEGCKHIGNTKNFKNLTILNMNRTGLTDEAITSLMSCPLPNLRKIHLHGNTFTEKGTSNFQSWRLSEVQIEYDDNKKKGKRKVKK